MSRKTYRYRSHKATRTELGMRIQEMARARCVIRISQDPCAAEPGGAEGKETLGETHLPGRRIDADAAEETSLSSTKGSRERFRPKQIKAHRGVPRMLCCDNESESSGQRMDL